MTKITKMRFPKMKKWESKWPELANTSQIFRVVRVSEIIQFRNTIGDCSEAQSIELRLENGKELIFSTATLNNSIELIELQYFPPVGIMLFDSNGRINSIEAI